MCPYVRPFAAMNCSYCPDVEMPSFHPLKGKAIVVSQHAGRTIRRRDDAIDEVGHFSELVLHDRARKKCVVHRQHTDGGRVARVRTIRLHLLFGVRVAIVQIERQRDRPFVFRDPDDDPGRGIAFAHDVAVLELRVHADAERRRTDHLWRLFFRRRRRHCGLPRRRAASLRRRWCRKRDDGERSEDGC